MTTDSLNNSRESAVDSDRQSPRRHRAQDVLYNLVISKTSRHSPRVVHPARMKFNNTLTSGHNVSPQRLLTDSKSTVVEHPRYLHTSV